MAVDVKYPPPAPYWATFPEDNSSVWLTHAPLKGYKHRNKAADPGPPGERMSGESIFVSMPTSPSADLIVYRYRPFPNSENRQWQSISLGDTVSERQFAQDFKEATFGPDAAYLPPLAAWHKNKNFGVSFSTDIAHLVTDLVRTDKTRQPFYIVVFILQIKDFTNFPNCVFCSDSEDLRHLLLRPLEQTTKTQFSKELITAFRSVHSRSELWCIDSTKVNVDHATAYKEYLARRFLYCIEESFGV